MEAIKLTEDHRSKLLEMCKTLFPEYDFGFDNDFSEEGILDYSIISEHKDKLSREWKFIHWFEFCMIYLAKKVYKSDGITLTFKDDNNNVIEFLYEQFKKLKQK